MTSIAPPLLYLSLPGDERRKILSTVMLGSRKHRGSSIVAVRPLSWCQEGKDGARGGKEGGLGATANCHKIYMDTNPTLPLALQDISKISLFYP